MPTPEPDSRLGGVADVRAIAAEASDLPTPVRNAAPCLLERAPAFRGGNAGSRRSANRHKGVSAGFHVLTPMYCRQASLSIPLSVPPRTKTGFDKVAEKPYD